MERELTEREMHYYYHGLYRVLKRYRTATVIGWVIVLAGVLGIPVGWSGAGKHGLVDLLLAGATIAGGLVLVSEAISFLETYLAIPFQAGGDGEAGADPPVLGEIRVIIEEIRAGGWQEAYGAIDRLRGLAPRYHVPPLEP